jgi:hypothetical protein
VCANCVSGAESVVAQAAAFTALARAGIARGHDALVGRDRAERRLAAYWANAEFLTGMGLDPAAVLGPPPEAPSAGRVASSGQPACAA